MNLQELAAKKQRVATFAKWGLAALAALVVAPTIFLVIKGIVGLSIAALLGLAVVNFAPAISMRFANWKLKAIKAEAARNPIETLQNVYNQRQAQRQKFKAQITAFRAKVSSFGDKVEGFKTQFPQDAQKYEAQLQKMHGLLKRREAKYSRVKADIEKFAVAIERADAFWKMSLAAAEMNEAAGVFDGEEVYERIKVETALDSVQDSMNMAFSEMESDFMEGDDVQLIENQSDDTALVIDVNVPQKEYAR